jgi:hypothetical protein
MARLVVLALALACTFVLASAGGGGGGEFWANQETSYSQLKPLKGQWQISVAATKSADKTLFVSQDGCNATQLTAACVQPLLTGDHGDKLSFNYTLGAPLRTFEDMVPQTLVFKACYTKPSTADRPWRKPSDVIDKDRACPFVVGTSPVNATSYSFAWSVPKNMTRGTWYAQVLAICTNGTGTSYCQFDNSANVTQWGTAIINSTPTTLVAATSVCAALGPLFLAGFFVKDVLLRKRS